MKDIARFIAGFQAFQKNYFCADNDLYQQLRNEQHPKTLLIGCSDSRVDPAILTGCSPGDIFVVRNVANLVPPCEDDGAYHGVSAAVEFAVRELEVEHAIVLGHSQCGGIHSLLSDKPKSGRGRFVARWMDIAAQAREQVERELAHKPVEIRERACEQAAILVSLENLLTYPWLKERVDAGRLFLHGWYFDLERGELFSYLPETGQFEPLVPRCEQTG